MAAFDRDSRWYHEPDWQLVQDSFVTLFRAHDRLDDTTTELRSRGYRVVTVNVGGWQSEADMHTSVAAALDFPDYYGENFAALDDCLRDVAAGDYGFDPTNDAGLVLVITGYDQFAVKVPRAALLLDIYSLQARGAALYGHRMMCLVQSDLPYNDFPPLGATHVHTASWPPNPPPPPN